MNQSFNQEGRQFHLPPFAY